MHKNLHSCSLQVLASGFEDQIARRRDQKHLDDNAQENEEEEDATLVGDESTLRGRVYNMLHRQHSPTAKLLKTAIHMLIIACAISFMFVSVAIENGLVHTLLTWFQFVSFLVFTLEYFLLIWSVGEDPKYRGRGRRYYARKFLMIVDALSIFPYWIGLVAVTGPAPSLFLLFKIFRVGNTSKAFLTMSRVIKEHMGVLTVTGFSAALLWIFFASILYYTERDNRDEQMQAYYNTIPNSMWITLLNLSGECPLAHYSNVGKVIQGFLGLFATAIFGIPST